jgi:hypothetical protein
MDRGQRFFVAIALFLLIAFIINLFINNIFVRGILLVFAFGALLRVLYQIAVPPERKRAKGHACEMRIVPELEVDMDGTVRQGVVPRTKCRKTRKAVRVKLDGKRSKKDDRS